MPEKIEQQEHTIVITVQGGLIQQINGIPHGTRVLVRDYDVESTDPSDLANDPDGDPCIESLWTPTEPPNA
jgi:hypothetical protein